MYEITIASKSGSYMIHIDGSEEPLTITGIAIADSNTKSHIDAYDVGSIIFIEASEKVKTLPSCESVIIKLNDLGLARSESLSAIGGGTTQDLVTLVASLYMRGVSWRYYPTTLMSMTDSCIGGKSAINAGDRKNLIGNFYPPNKIYVDTRFLETNSNIDMVNGLSEAAKICFARGAEAFDQYLSLPASLNPGNDENTARLINHTLTSKKWFVEVDEFDARERQFLNFGHSFAHALESATSYKIPHGIAVGIGMIAALKHPVSLKSKKAEMLTNYSLKILELTRSSIVEGMLHFDQEKFVVALARDKKNSKEFLRLVLLNSSDELELVSLERNDYQLQVALEALNAAIAEVLG
jgi:3-dehydroquinate synthase